MQLIDKIDFIPKKRVKNKIFFLHMPKCGGTSVNEAIQRSFGSNEKTSYFHLRARASFRAAEMTQSQLTTFREQLLIYCMYSNDYRYISGHFNYNHRVFQEFRNEWSYITILRQPVQKWISQYFYDRYKIGFHCKINSNIEEFVDSERGISFGSEYVKKLLEPSTNLDLRSDEAINLAIKNLSNFRLVGVLEELSTFISNYENIFGVRLKVNQKNSNPLSKVQQQEKITDKVLQKIEEICQPDNLVYQSILEKIQNR